MPFGIPNPFKHKPTLEELQTRDEYEDVELSVAKKEALIRELKMRGGDWRLMSDNGKKSGINFSRVWEWLKSH